MGFHNKIETEQHEDANRMRLTLRPGKGRKRQQETSHAQLEVERQGVCILRLLSSACEERNNGWEGRQGVSCT